MHSPSGVHAGGSQTPHVKPLLRFGFRAAKELGLGATLALDVDLRDQNALRAVAGKLLRADRASLNPIASPSRPVRARGAEQIGRRLSHRPWARSYVLNEFLGEEDHRLARMAAAAARAAASRAAI